MLAHIAVYVFFSLYLDAFRVSQIDHWRAVGGVCGGRDRMVLHPGALAARWPLSRWLLVCAAAMALRMGMTAAAGAWLLVLVVAQMLHALTFAAHHTACMALLSEYFPGRLRGRGQALYTCLAYGPPGVVGALAGRFGRCCRQASVYWAAMAASVLSCLCAWKVGHSAPKERSLE